MTPISQFRVNRSPARAVILAAIVFVGACATHQPSDSIAVVFGRSISYGAVESEPLVTNAGVSKAVFVSPGKESLAERARRCGWTEQELNLYRFRQLFLAFFIRGYQDRIASDVSRNAVRPHPSRTPPRGSGLSAASFILIENHADPKTVHVAPRPDLADWLVRKALYLKDGGRVSKRHGWLPIDALQKVVSQSEATDEIRFIDSSYRSRFWGYFDSLKDDDFATQAEAAEYFRVPWWETPLPDSVRKHVKARELARSLAPEPCTPP